jgi:hypothetical protein
MKELQKYVVSFIGVGVLLALTIQEAGAIPAWARKYGTSCATCHELFPRNNAVGEAFRLNGYKFRDDEAYVKEPPVVQGQEAYKKVWPKAIWPSDIPGLPPLSIRAILDYNIDAGGTKETSNQFEMPHEIELLMGGTFGENISFLGEVEWEDEGEVETAIEAWIMFEDLLGTENAFNVRVGRVGAHELGLFTARDSNRLTNERYLYGNWRIPYPGGFDTRNAFRLRNTQPGIEVNGFGTRWRYVVGLVNGNDGSVEDNNSEKDVYFQLAFKFNGLRFDGSGGGETKELGAAGKGIWQDDSVTASLFGYRGVALVNATGDEADARDDDFWRLGIGAQVKYRDLKIGGGFAWGDNDNPYGTLSGESVDSRAWFVEFEYFIYPWLVPSLRFETLDFDLPDVPGLRRNQDQARFILNVDTLIRANIRLISEARLATEDERFAEDNDDNRVSFRMEFGF